MQSFKPAISNCRPDCKSLIIASDLLKVIYKMKVIHDRYQFLLPEHIAKDILDTCNDALMDAHVNLPD